MRSVVRRRREVQATKQRMRCGTYEARAPALYSDPRDRASIVCWHRPIEKRYHALDHDARTATRRSQHRIGKPRPYQRPEDALRTSACEQITRALPTRIPQMLLAGRVGCCLSRNLGCCQDHILRKRPSGREGRASSQTPHESFCPSPATC